MVEGGDGPGFLLEAAEPVGVRGDVVGQDLDRDVAAEAGVPRAVDRTHAAGPEKLGDLVLGYLAAGMTQDQIMEEFPQLTGDDVRACLAYAAERERRTLTILAA